MMRLYVFLLMVAVVSLSSCRGQTIAHTEGQSVDDQQSTSVDDQLSTLPIGRRVTALDDGIWITFQGKNNDYWFGSNGNGLYRYDGESIVHFTTEDGLLNNSIRGIQEDHQGRVFIASMDGVSMFDGQRFTTVPIVESNEWQLNPTDLWFSILGKTGENGPYRYDGKVLHHLHFPKHYMEDEYFKIHGRRSWSPYEPYTIYRDSRGHVWFGTSGFGICRYDGQSLSWMYEEHLTLIEGGGDFGIRSILEDEDGKFWFTNTSYRYDIHPKPIADAGKVLIDYEREAGIKDIISPQGRPMIYFMSAAIDDDGDLWMVTYEQGVWRYDGQTTTHYRVMEDGQDITLFSIYKDRQGGLWLGTHESGAYKFNGTTFEKFEL